MAKILLLFWTRLLVNLQRGEVKTLAVGIFEGEEHYLKFNGQFLASGVYMLKLILGGQSET